MPKMCFCIGADKCRDYSCRLVKEWMSIHGVQPKQDDKIFEELLKQKEGRYVKTR